MRAARIVGTVSAGVVELVDTPDLGSGGASRGGSSPFARTIRVRHRASDHTKNRASVHRRRAASGTWILSMQVTETLNEGLKRAFKVVVEAGEIDSKVNNRLAEIAPTLNLPGFRPGKVPPSLLKKRYGRSLLGEVLEQAVNETSQQALDERGYRPATQPQIEITQFDEGQDLEYDLSVELMPEIAPMDFSALSLVRPKAEPSDKDIDDALERMAGEQKRSEPIKGKRKSKKGDVLVLDFTGYIDGEAFEGGSAEGQQLELGSNTFIPGFEDQLVGAKAGEAVTVEVTFPDDYPRADYAGKLATFECQVTEIREPVAVEIDDEFAKNFGLEDLAALREAIGQQIGQEFTNAGRLKAKQRLLEKLADNHDFELPEGMVEAEYAEICRQVKGQQAPQEAGEETGPTSEAEADAGPDARPDAAPAPDEGFSDEDKADYRDAAHRRVRLGLLLAEVGRMNNIQVADEEVQRAILQQATRFPGQERQVMEFYQSNPQARASVQAPLFEDKVVDFILEMAQVEDEIVAAEDLFRDDDAEPVEAKPAEKSAAKPAKKKAAAKKPRAKKAAADSAKSTDEA